MAKYLDLDFKTALMYEYNKTEKEGFEEHVSSTGNKGYRKYYRSGVTGELLSASLYTTDRGDKLSLTLRDESGDFLYFPIPLYDQKGQIDSRYAQSLIKVLPNLEKGQSYTFFPYNFIPENSSTGKAITGVSVKQDGVKVENAIESSYFDKTKGEVVKKDIPALEWKEDKFSKKMKPTASSIEAKDDYLKDVLSKQFDRLERDDTDKSSEAKKPAVAVAKEEFPKISAEQAFAPNSDDDDDLPF